MYTHCSPKLFFSDIGHKTGVEISGNLAPQLKRWDVLMGVLRQMDGSLHQGETKRKRKRSSLSQLGGGVSHHESWLINWV